MKNNFNVNYIDIQTSSNSPTLQKWINFCSFTYKKIINILSNKAKK